MLDRNQLSKLYPEAGSRAGMNSLHGKGVKKIFVRVDFKSILSISLLLTISIITLITIIGYFSQTIDAFNIINLLPFIAILLISWVGFSVFISMKISNILDKTAVNEKLFLVVYALIVLPVSQFLFNVYRNLNNGSVDILPFAGVLFLENLIFVAIILKLMNSERISNKPKLGLFILTVLFCGFITYLNSFY